MSRISNLRKETRAQYTEPGSGGNFFIDSSHLLSRKSFRYRVPGFFTIIRAVLPVTENNRHIPLEIPIGLLILLPEDYCAKV